MEYEYVKPYCDWIAAVQAYFCDPDTGALKPEFEGMTEKDAMIQFELQHGISEASLQESIAMAMREGGLIAVSELAVYLTSVDENGQLKYVRAFREAVIQKHEDTSEELLSDRIMHILTEDCTAIH